MHMNLKRIFPMFRLTASSLALVIALALAGCSNTNPTPPIYGHDDPFAARQIQFDSVELQNDTAVNKPIVSRDPAGLLHVTVPIRSNIDKDLHVDYRVTFFDASRAPIETTSMFTTVLRAYTPSSITVNSTSPAATDFQVDFGFAQ
jgi:uncharacterized protein YcfL